MRFVRSRVVTRNFVVDWWEGLKNLFGFRLSGYERMIDRAVIDLNKELPPKTLWYRYEITELKSGAIVILFYGEAK